MGFDVHAVPRVLGDRVRLRDARVAENVLANEHMIGAFDINAVARVACVAANGVAVNPDTRLARQRERTPRVDKNAAVRGIDGAWPRGGRRANDVIGNDNTLGCVFDPDVRRAGPGAVEAQATDGDGRS